MAIHYVSPTGTDTWANSTNIGTPCAAATAIANAAAGDTVYFRGGNYSVGQSSGWPSVFDWRPANSGTAGNPITFMAYPGETPIVNGTVTSGNDNTHVFGAVNRNYIIWDGFTGQANGGVKMASVLFYGTDHCEMRNCTINGGTTVITSTDNRECLRIEQSTNITVSSCTIYNYYQTTNWHNTSAIKMYHNAVGVIENCVIYNGTTGIYVKSDSDDFIIRNNFIHDMYSGIYVTPSMEVMQSDRGHVYNNIIANAIYSAFESDSDGTAFHGDDWEIYNNTFYNTNSGISISGNTAGHGWTIYNNISQGQTYDLYTHIYSSLATEDHNQWGTGSLDITYHLYDDDQAKYTSITAWETSGKLEGGGNPGVGDLASSPLFVNSSGNMNILADFALQGGSPCIGTGRSSANMGADISQVGVTGIGEIDVEQVLQISEASNSRIDTEQVLQISEASNSRIDTEQVLQSGEYSRPYVEVQQILAISDATRPYVEVQQVLWLVEYEIVNPPPTVTLVAIPDTIYEGEDSTLFYTSQYADTLVIDQGIGSVVVPDGDALTGILFVTTTYTITATNPYGVATATAIVTVLVRPIPPIPPTPVPPEPVGRFRLYRKDCEVRIKQWGSTEAYAIVKPFGGEHFVTGAEI